MRRNRFKDLSIKFKFILGIVGILIVTTLTLSAVFIRQSERLLIEALEGKAELLNRNFSIVSAKGIQESAYTNLQSLIDEVAAKDREIKLLIVAYPNRMIIATSDQEKFRQFSKIDDPYILGQLQKKESRISRDRNRKLLRSIRIIYSQPDNPAEDEEDYDYEEETGNDDTENEPTGDAEIPSEIPAYQAEVIGFIYIELDTGYLEKSISDLRNYSIFIALLLMGAGIAGAYGFGAAMSGPIGALAEDVRIIASGNLEKSIQSESRDELGQLVCDVETMRISIKDLTDNLEDKVRERTKQLQEATDSLAEANKEITDLNEQLKEENMRMSAELEVTRKLQQMVLPAPEELEHIETLEIACYMDPADEVGGDYYDILRYNGATKIGIGDVTGHGLESGVVMLMTQTAVRTLLTSGETDPKRFLSILNRTIFDNVQRMNIDKTLTLALLDYTSEGEGRGSVRLSGQHEEMLVVSRDGQVRRVDTIDLGVPVGLVEDIADFIGEEKVLLKSGEGIVLFSDGITEAEDMDEELYEIERLCEAVSRNWQKSAEEIRDAVIQDVREYIGKQIVYDDIALVVLKQR